MCALAPKFYVLLIARLLLGHSSASSMVAAPMYTCEISQPQIRKTTGSFNMSCFSTGFALVVIFGMLISKLTNYTLLNSVQKKTFWQKH